MTEELHAAVRCLRCEYDLRGLGREGNCPECGMSVELSQRRWEMETSGATVPLELTSRAFLRRMGWGCVLVLVAVWVPGLMTSWYVIHPPSVAPTPSRMMMFSSLLFVLMTLAMAGGLWLLGSREPATARPRDLLRYLIRGAGVLYLLFAIVVPLLIAHLVPWLVHAAATTLLAVAVTWPVHRRLAELFRRGGAHSLWPRIARDLAWALPAMMLVQGTFFRFIEIHTSARWMITPEPIVGPLRAVFLLPLVPMLERSPELVDLFWLMMAALSLLAVLVLVRATRMLLSRKEVRG